MGQLVNKICELYQKCSVSDSIKIVSVNFIRPETIWSIHKQIEVYLKKIFGGSNSCMVQNIEWICE